MTTTSKQTGSGKMHMNEVTGPIKLDTPEQERTRGFQVAPLRRQLKDEYRSTLRRNLDGENVDDRATPGNGLPWSGNDRRIASLPLADNYSSL